MAYRVPGPAHGTVRWYTPETGGNLERTGSDQIRVQLRHPTEGERREFMADYKDGETVGEHMAWQLRAIEACVVKVENYEDSTGAPIDDAKTLLQHGEPDLVAEIAGEAGSGYKLSEEQRKNSESSSGTSSASTQA